MGQVHVKEEQAAEASEARAPEVQAETHEPPPPPKLVRRRATQAKEPKAARAPKVVQEKRLQPKAN